MSVGEYMLTCAGVNDGNGSACRSCATSNRECSYPASGTTSTAKREPGIKQEEGESKKRVRKVEDTGRRNSARTEDPIDNPILTSQVMNEVYELFKANFSTEMPFFHPQTFRQRLRAGAYPRDSSKTLSNPQEGRVIMLGVLTLTARFHPTLVLHHSQAGKPQDPLDASEYYASALKSALSPSSNNLTNPTLDNIQALLMLGLYEWGQSRGLTGWVYVGIAIRLAQAVGLWLEDDPEHRIIRPTTIGTGANTSPEPKDEIIKKEVRRRTLWSCYILDRMLSAGKARPNMLSSDRLRVFLPCPDQSFSFGMVSPPSFLDTNWLEHGKKHSSPVGNDDGALSRYIRLLNIFGKLSEWSYAGGRRTEGTTPPWKEKSTFYKLSKELEQWHEALPSNLTFTVSNLTGHIEYHNATVYVSMHTLYCLCLIILHREYIPFLPLRGEGLDGPLDAPLFPLNKYPPPGNWWRESAAKICKAARDIIDIVRTCQDNNALPETPHVGFTVYQAAFICLYIHHFEHMDTQDYIRGKHDQNGGGLDILTVKILKDMAPRSKMAKSYVKTLHKMHNYFTDTIKEEAKRYPDGKSRGGGLNEYLLLEKELKEFGSLEDADKSIPSDGSDNADQGRSRASTNDLGAGNNVEEQGDVMQGVEGAPPPRPQPWAAVNAASPSMEESKYIPGQPHPYSLPFQSPSQNSNPPSLGTSNGDSTPGIHSPYNQQQSHYQQGSNYSGYPVQQSVIANSAGQQQTFGNYSQDDNEAWLKQRHQITMGGMDNFVQDAGVGIVWPQGFEDGYPPPQNFFGVVNGDTYGMVGYT